LGARGGASVVAKEHELRITMIGRRALAAKVLSQETRSGRTDWRQSYHELRFEAVTLDPGVAEMCFELMVGLGIVFGCFDLIVTPEGEHVFLEVNEMASSFSWSERPDFHLWTV
jgi:glutathione synthase/RimK-type ligase-like ATP-grasp enzyme